MMKGVILLFTVCTLASTAEHGLTFYSGPLLFRPLAANTFEPRLGLIWHADDNRLRLDIGNSVDMLQYSFDDASKRITFGADFFTYTLLRGEPNFHFPVDAVDYFFGFSLNYSDTLNSNVIAARLRLSHISAHFADGHFDGSTGVWKDGLSPRVYSREFFDLAVSYEHPSGLRGYAGVIYLWHVDPTTIDAFSGYSGAEYHSSITTHLNGFAAYQLSVSGFRPRHELQTGMKIGTWSGRGTKLFFIHHAGNSIHGEYFDRRDNYSGIGFTIDF